MQAVQVLPGQVVLPLTPDAETEFARRMVLVCAIVIIICGLGCGACGWLIWVTALPGYLIMIFGLVTGIIMIAHTTSSTSVHQSSCCCVPSGVFSTMRGFVILLIVLSVIMFAASIYLITLIMPYVNSADHKGESGELIRFILGMWIGCAVSSFFVCVASIVAICPLGTLHQKVADAILLQQQSLVQAAVGGGAAMQLQQQQQQFAVQGIAHQPYPAAGQPTYPAAQSYPVGQPVNKADCQTAE